MSQSIEQQVDSLRSAGAVVYADHGISGASKLRTGFAAALDELQHGDALVVVALDRLGRDLADLIGIVETLRQRNVELRSLRKAIDTTTAGGRMLPDIFGALAEYERSIRAERTAARLAEKRRRGERVGRKPVLTQSQVDLARRELEGARSAGSIARNLHCGRPTLCRALARFPVPVV